jgi:threonine dehydratase
MHVERAYEVIRGKVIRTPLVYSQSFSKLFGCEIYIKLENLQETGSFKLRGATYKILSQLERIGPEGVIAASAGNHAQGVALASTRAGKSSTIIMPTWASITKQEATLAYGGKVILAGDSLPESIEMARDAAHSGKIFIHPFDDPAIIAGQGTIGIEILEDLQDLDAVIVPVGGGGLISGIATAVKALRPDAQVIGVQAAACPSAFHSLQSGTVEQVVAAPSIADGISVKQVGELTFSIMQQRVDRVVLVEEDQIAAAILMLLERKKLLCEGAGAVPLAALMSGSVVLSPGSKVVLVVSGGNVDSPLLDRIIRKGLVRNGRIMRFFVCLDDSPGALARLLNLVAELKANVFHIDHKRTGSNLPVHLSSVELQLETRGEEHIEKLRQALQSAGYRIQSSEMHEAR